MQSPIATASQINQMMLRPFRVEVDLETVALALALVLVATGGWHFILERVEL
jgi:hypothetical protein